VGLVLYSHSATAMDGTIDLGPVAVSLLDLTSGLAVTALGWLGLLLRSFLKSKTDLYTQEVDERVRTYLDAIVYTAIDYAVDRIREQAAAGAFAFNAKSEVIEFAGEFITAHAPDAVRRFGLTPEKIANTVRARLDLDLLSDAKALAA
jgi:hypothetical protein